MNHMPNCLTMSSSHHYFAASYQIFMVPSETITHIVILSNSWYSAARVGMDNIVQKEQESKSKTYIWTHFIDHSGKSQLYYSASQFTMQHPKVRNLA